MKANDLIKLLQKNGWYKVRQKGSHVILNHPTNPNTIVVPEHGKKDMKPGTLNIILKTAGLK